MVGLHVVSLHLPHWCSLTCEHALDLHQGSLRSVWHHVKPPLLWDLLHNSTHWTCTYAACFSMCNIMVVTCLLPSPRALSQGHHRALSQVSSQSFAAGFITELCCRFHHRALLQVSSQSFGAGFITELCCRFHHRALVQVLSQSFGAGFITELCCRSHQRALSHVTTNGCSRGHWAPIAFIPQLLEMHLCSCFECCIIYISIPQPFDLHLYAHCLCVMLTATYAACFVCGIMSVHMPL